MTPPSTAALLQWLAVLAGATPEEAKAAYHERLEPLLTRRTPERPT